MDDGIPTPIMQILHSLRNLPGHTDPILPPDANIRPLMEQLKQVTPLTIIHKQIEISAILTHPNKRHQTLMLANPNQRYDLSLKFLNRRRVLLFDFFDGGRTTFAATHVDFSGATTADDSVKFEVLPLEEEGGVDEEEGFQGLVFEGRQELDGGGG